MNKARVALLFLASPLAIFGQAAPATPATIQVTGRASASARPDQAELSVGVSSVGQTALAAAELNARDSNSLMSKLRDTFKSSIEVETSNYSVSPDYEQQLPRDSEALRRYRVTNTVHVTIKNLADVSKVIDAALSSGANRMQGLTFKVKDATGLERKALQDAARDAQAKANAMAGALGLRVTGIKTVTESGGGPRPVPMFRAAAAESFAPPIEPGTYDTEASVMMEVFVAPR